jgi:DnaJ-domain-containing protein 1
VDPIFDRLGNLLRSLFQDSGSDDDRFGGRGGYAGSSGDSDLDAAYEELNDFLNRDMGESERRERENLRRAREEARARAGSQGQWSGGTYQHSPAGPPIGLVNDYKALGLPFGSKLPEVKAAYKRLLKANHPDLHAGDPEALKRATAYSATVNAAYQRIETWLTTGKYENG